jgi:hypothetical protein
MKIRSVVVEFHADRQTDGHAECSNLLFAILVSFYQRITETFIMRKHSFERNK